MEPRYQTNVRITYEEYKKFGLAIQNKMNHLPFSLLVIAVLMCLLAYLSSNIGFVFAAIAVPIAFCFFYARTIKRTYESNKSMQDLNSSYLFYGDHLEQVNEMGRSVIEYSKLYRVLETKTNFYLMIAKNQGCIILKENCSEELVSFLRTLQGK